MQRLRLTFARGDDGKFIGHLDMARLWERAARRARLPIAYSHGFTPHARISFAAPLAVGVTADAELVDLYLTEPLPPAEVRDRLAAQMPPGLALREAAEIELGTPSVQSQVRAAVYLAEFDAPAPGLAEAVAAFLARDAVPYTRRREGKSKNVDLRPYVEALAVLPGEAALRLRLRLDNDGSVRPEEVLAALGLGELPARLRRATLVLADTEGTG